jgi:glycosyltransferase involved in cell wall biosynthesis
MNNILTVIIPSKTERFLEQTTRDVLEKSSGEIEVVVILDGYELPDNEIVKDPRVNYLHLEPQKIAQKRHGINAAVKLAKGDYVMALDAHCMMAKGFDEQLIKDHKPNWVQIPRRHRLDPIKWSLQPQSDNRPPIDYEYIIFPSLIKDHAIHGFKWDERTLEKWDTPIDDTIQFQGSCWFMTKDWFNERGFMQTEGYTGWGQEAEEISMETWKNGGEVKTNKNTWYAHLHKGVAFGRMYWMSREENRRSYAYSYNKWLVENKESFIETVKKFPKMPGWPNNWEEIIRELK